MSEEERSEFIEISKKLAKGKSLEVKNSMVTHVAEVMSEYDMLREIYEMLIVDENSEVSNKAVGLYKEDYLIRNEIFDIYVQN